MSKNPNESSNIDNIKLKGLIADVNKSATQLTNFYSDSAKQTETSLKLNHEIQKKLWAALESYYQCANLFSAQEIPAKFRNPIYPIDQEQAILLQYGMESNPPSLNVLFSLEEKIKNKLAEANNAFRQAAAQLGASDQRGKQVLIKSNEMIGVFPEIEQEKRKWNESKNYVLPMLPIFLPQEQLVSFMNLFCQHAKPFANGEQKKELNRLTNLLSLISSSKPSSGFGTQLSNQRQNLSEALSSFSQLSPLLNQLKEDPDTKDLRGLWDEGIKLSNAIESKSAVNINQNSLAKEDILQIRRKQDFPNIFFIAENFPASVYHKFDSLEQEKNFLLQAMARMKSEVEGLDKSFLQSLVLEYVNKTNAIVQNNLSLYPSQEFDYANLDGKNKIIASYQESLAAAREQILQLDKLINFADKILVPIYNIQVLPDEVVYKKKAIESSLKAFEAKTDEEILKITSEKITYFLRWVGKNEDVRPAISHALSAEQGSGSRISGIILQEGLDVIKPVVNGGLKKQDLGFFGKLGKYMNKSEAATAKQTTEIADSSVSSEITKVPFKKL